MTFLNKEQERFFKLNKYIDKLSKYRNTQIFLEGARGSFSLMNEENPSEEQLNILNIANTITDEEIDALHIGDINWDGFNHNMQVAGLFAKFYQASKKHLPVFVAFTMVVLTITQWKTEDLLVRYWYDFKNEYETASTSDPDLEALSTEDLSIIRTLLYNNYFNLSLFGFEEE